MDDPADLLIVNGRIFEGYRPGDPVPFGSDLGPRPSAATVYGHGSAFAAFAEGRRGTLSVGADADIVVLERDMLAEGPSAIIGSRVASTVVGGAIVHASEDLG